MTSRRNPDQQVATARVLAAAATELQTQPEHITVLSSAKRRRSSPRAGWCYDIDVQNPAGTQLRYRVFDNGELVLLR